MHVGAAEVVITPPLGVELAGYGPRRERRSTAIDRQLTAHSGARTGRTSVSWLEP